MARSVIKKQLDTRLKLTGVGSISIRNIDDDTTTYIDIMDSPGNGVIIGVSTNGISVFRQVNGVQTALFMNH